MKAMRKGIAARIAALERLPPGGGRAPEVHSFWDNELVACEREPNCSVAVATGEHLSKVIRLSWRETGT